MPMVYYHYANGVLPLVVTDAASKMGYVNDLLPLVVSVVRACLCLSPGRLAGGAGVGGLYSVCAWP